MAEREALEAAAKSNVAVLRFLLEVGVNAHPASPRFEEFRTALENHTRRAIAAYEAERTADLDELAGIFYDAQHARKIDSEWALRGIGLSPVAAGLAAVFKHLGMETR